MEKQSETFGSFIRAKREAKKLSLAGAAKVTGVTKPHLWSLEKDQNVNPTVVTLRGIASAYAVSPASLLRLAIQQQEDALIAEKGKGRE